jgi:hypothetical protein
MIVYEIVGGLVIWLEIVGGLVILGLILTGLHTVLKWAEDKGNKKGKTS